MLRSLYAGCRSASSFRRHFSAGSKNTLSKLTTADLQGKNVFVRVDFNVPLNKTTGEIEDDTRIRGAIPTIKYLKDAGAKVVLCSHVGRPKKGNFEGLYMKPLAAHLAGLLDAPIEHCSDVIGEEVSAKASAMKNGDVLMLENVRFHAEETKNIPEFAFDMVNATKAQVYVNDAFGTAHRAHASTEGVTNFIDGPCVAGFLLSKELDFLYGAVDKSERPFAAIVGGAKVSTKISVLETLMDKCDKLVLGGAMVFTFLKARGVSVGASMVEDESLELARRVEALAKEKGVELFLPKDVVVADSFAKDAKFKTVNVDDIPDGWFGLDVGPEFSSDVDNALDNCKTILWNGPMGVFEWSNFSSGTFGVAKKMAEMTDKGCVTIVGGGDSVSAVEKCKVAERISHISTGGGASLELLEGKVLPGVACLDDA